MARGKAANINQIKHIIVGELIGLSHSEIANNLSLHKQTIDRVKKNEDYHKIRKHLAEILLSTSSSELLRL